MPEDRGLVCHLSSTQWPFALPWLRFQAEILLHWFPADISGLFTRNRLILLTNQDFITTLLLETLKYLGFTINSR